MYKKWNLFIILTMLLGLVFTSPAQIVSAEASAIADFTFTSSVNPSNFGQEVTFSLSATGSDSTYPPFGYVEFFDNGISIPYCNSVPLNYTNGSPAEGNPAFCSTTSLAVGTHTITAKFFSILPDKYADDTLTLVDGQTVDDSIVLTIYPSDLSDATLTIYYEIPFTAYYPGGSECSNCTWYTTLGNTPDGFGLSGSTGVLQGTPTTTGVYSFTVVADDGNGAHGSRAYTWNVTKVKTVVDVGINSTTYVGNTEPTSLGATARHPNPYYSPAPTGTISFAVNGVPVPGCSGPDAKKTNNEGAAYCTSYLPTGLAAGDYNIQADFTPDAGSSETYLSGTGTGTLQVNPPQAIVSGRVFMDENQNAIYDEGEAAEGTWHVNLNQDCDSFLEGDVVTDPISGSFTFYPVPIENHTYCLYVNLSGFPDGSVQTTPYNDLTLIDYQYFEIGIYYPNISILPNSEELQSGTVGIYYEQTFVISGGTPPYTIEPTTVLPAGLIFDKDTLTLSGTPIAGGLGQLNLYVTDSNGLSASREYSFKVMAEGVFTFTSSSNPSTPGVAVTFTVSASGEANTPYGQLPPVGAVTIFADEIEIEGCSFLYLNVMEDEYGEPVFGNYPAMCTTAALLEGSHEITAIYFDAFEIYNQPTLSLTQLVGMVEPLKILPDTLATAAYQTTYSQQLSVNGGVEPFIFSLYDGSLPNGLTLSSDGLISGFADYPAAPGTYPIIVQATDGNGIIALGYYDFVLEKGEPEVTVNAATNIYWNYPFNISAEVTKHTSSSSAWALEGTVAFYIDNQLVSGCEAVPYLNTYYSCYVSPNNLTVGTHTVRAEYTPTGWYANYYTTGSASKEFAVQSMKFMVQGYLFEDENQNMVYDTDENRIFENGWTINLDENCDGAVDRSTTTSWGGFVFTDVPSGGQCYRITADGMPGYQQTTILEDFVLTESIFVPIGFYYPNITLSPSEYDLPSGTMGVEYNQNFSASGGTGPYSYSINNGTLPEGLTLSADGILSGTPSMIGYYYFTVIAKDANQATGFRNYSLSIKTDGIFNLTSSTNPSTLGVEVTFTVSANGGEFTPYPPTGTITFYADGTPIDGCSDLFLNMDQNWNMGEFPALCKTAGLEAGNHTITVTYLDWTGFYNDTTLTLTQVVNAPVSADLSIDKTDSKDPVKPGSKLVYSLMVSNLGSDLAESIIVTDKLDVTTTFLSVSAPKGWTCSYAENSGTVICTTDNMASGSNVIIKITVLVNKTAKVGKDLVNNAFVSSTTFDQDMSNNAVVQKTLVVK